MATPFKSVLGVCHRAAFALRFAWRSRTWQSAMPKERPGKAPVIVSGFMNEALGIGRAAQLTVNALTAAGHTTISEDLRPFDRGLLTKKAMRLPVTEKTIWIIHANPPEARIALYTHDYRDWRDLYRIGYWAWESSCAPANWVDMAAWFHEIWVPSAFVADALMRIFQMTGKSHESKKIRVIPHPVSIGPATTGSRAPNPLISALTLFDPRSDLERKNPMGAITAWLTAFPTSRPDARLIVKTYPTALDHPGFAEVLAVVRARTDIVLQAEILSDAGTIKLINSCDILISLHRGEGFGLTLAEAMSMGLSVIATGWSGNMQFMTHENSIPVPYRLVPANRQYNGPQAQWAEPDIEAAALALQQLVTDASLREKLGRQAIADIHKLSAAWAPDKLFNAC